MNWKAFQAELQHVQSYNRPKRSNLFLIGYTFRVAVKYKKASEMRE